MNPQNDNDTDLRNVFPNDSTSELDSESAPINEALTVAVAKFLRQIQEPESCPEGLAPENGESPNPDLYTLLENMASLRREISLQGRSFHQSQQALDRLLKESENWRPADVDISVFSQQMAQLQKSVDSWASASFDAMRKTGREEGRREVLTTLIDPFLDIHDQLRRLEEAHVRRDDLSLWQRFRGVHPCLEDFQNTVSLSGKRIGQRLHSVGISPIARNGMEFNPNTMKAVDMVESRSCDKATVIEIYRQGYTYEEQILRFAEVKVVCPRKKKKRHFFRFVTRSYWKHRKDKNQ